MQLTTTSEDKAPMVEAYVDETSTGEPIMGEGLTSDTAATLALLADTSRAGGRGMYGGYGEGGGYGGQFAGPTANAIRIESGNKASAAGLENLLDQNQFEATNKNVTDCCNRSTDQMFRSELRGADQAAAFTAQITAANAAAALAACEARLCCKETQCLVKEENAATRLLLVDTARQTAVDANNVSTTVNAINNNANANTAAIVNAINNK